MNNNKNNNNNNNNSKGGGKKNKDGERRCIEPESRRLQGRGTRTCVPNVHVPTHYQIGVPYNTPYIYIYIYISVRIQATRAKERKARTSIDA